MNTAIVHQQQGLPSLAQSELPEMSIGGELQTAISPNSPQMDSVAAAMGQHSAFPKLNEIRRPPSSTNETKVIYHLEDKDCPTVIKIPIAPNAITLRDLKAFLSLPKSHFKFYFKSMDKDVGVVKEQIFDDNSLLPLYQGKVVAFIESADGANSQCTSEMSSRTNGQMTKRHGLVSDSTFHSSTDHCGDTTETDSMISSRRGGQYMSPRHRSYNNCKSNHHSSRYGKCSNRYHRSGHHGYDSSVVTSDMESYVDSDDDDYDEDFMENDVDSDDDYDDYSSRISSTTEETSVSRQYARKHRPRHRRSYRNQDMSRTSSVSSFSEMSLNVIQVNLNLDVVNYLGISLVGQTSQKGDGGIYVSSIMKGGAVDLDGRIEPGDMILQVNDINFNMLTNDEAVQVIREAVKKPGPIKLLVAKCWDPNPKGYFTIPRSEPVRPIDPGAWVAHTEAARAKYTNHETNLPLNGSLASYAAGSGGMPTSAMSETDRQLFQQPQVPVQSVPSFANSANTYSLSNSSVTYGPNSLVPRSPLRNSFKSGHSVTIAPNPTAIQVPPSLTTETNIETIACAMASPDSGLDVRDRMWLKIRIPNAFIGSDVVHWLYSCVSGFHDRKDAKKFASKLLKQGYIQHTINLKNSFSEKCYYVFSEVIMQKVNLASDQSGNGNLNGLEEGFANGLRLTNENFQQNGVTMEQANFTSLTGQHFGIGNNELATASATVAANTAANSVLSAPNQAKPGMCMMPFMRYWDETSEIHNYGLFGPTQIEAMANAAALNDGTGSNHSGGGGNHGHDPYQSDEQMSQRSGQSVLYNPQASQGPINVATNTMASSGSNGSRQTNNSNHQSNVSNGNPNMNSNSANSTTGNILNHHYEDLQMNHATGNLVPASLANDEIKEYHQHQQQQQQQQHTFIHNSHMQTFAQGVYRHGENDDLSNGDTVDLANSGLNSAGNHEGGDKGPTASHVFLSDEAGYCDPCQEVS